MSNTYRYGAHHDLSKPERFFFIAVAQTCAQVGIDDVEGGILILAGWPRSYRRDRSSPARPEAPSLHPSCPAAFSATRAEAQGSAHIDPAEHEVAADHPHPPPERFYWTRHPGGVGWVLLARDVALISYHTVRKYNFAAQPEDRIF